MRLFSNQQIALMLWGLDKIVCFHVFPFFTAYGIEWTEEGDLFLLRNQIDYISPQKIMAFQ